jgi:DNA-binding NarL/FixJ family response regulator
VLVEVSLEGLEACLWGSLPAKVAQSIHIYFEKNYSSGVAPMTRSRVLLADDLAQVLSAVAALLEKQFEIVATVKDGRAALEKAMALAPDLVVLDISMPGLSGIEVARELKKHGSKAKVVFLTVHEDADILAACLAVGGLGYVVKVLMQTDLIPAMKEALADRPFVSRFSSPATSLNSK